MLTVNYCRYSLQMHLLCFIVMLCRCGVLWLLLPSAVATAFLHWVGIALHPGPFVSDIAIFVLKGDVKLQLTIATAAGCCVSYCRFMFLVETQANLSWLQIAQNYCCRQICGSSNCCCCELFLSPVVDVWL